MTPEQVATLVDATASALALPIADAHRPGVLAFFGLAASMADLVQGMPLDTGDESGAVFVPVAPKGAS